MNDLAPLPIDAILPALKSALRTETGAVLVAEPGAGKTTRTPLALLAEAWLRGQRILMLEPRRLAARAAAAYMARSLGEQVGETVGYRIRLESRVSARTRVEVITEGILTRLIQADPALEGVGLVIFDEFHERSLHADLGLALCLQSRALLRPDLRVLVMSATLAAEPVAALLGGAPVLTSEGRTYPVATRYLERPSEGRIEQAVARAVREALASEEGDLLVFLPGAREIGRVESLLAEAGLGAHVRVRPLHGDLPQEAQDRAIAPCPPGERKVVLATSIAETSLTVAGVRVVIDSGLMRVPRFSPRTGMTRLETIPVSRAAADQRRGRAGRLAPGVCFRLWTEQQDRSLVPYSAPEIREADLAPLALELAAWGANDPGELLWLDPPPAATLAQGRELLMQLGALGPGGGITPHGRAMAQLGLHPRLAHMLLKAQSLGLAPLACDLAALLSERDLLRGAPADVDIRTRVEALRRGGAEQSALRRVRQAAAHFRQQLPPGPDSRPSGSQDADAAGLLLAFAYPDRIAQRRGAGRFRLRSGRGAAMPPDQLLAGEEYLVAAELDDQGAESRIFLAAPIALADLRAHFADQISQEQQVAWDRTAQAVRARVRERLGALILSEGRPDRVDPEAVRAALIDGITAEGLEMLPWTRAAQQLQARLRFLHAIDPGWPDLSDETLLADLSGWLGPHLDGMRSRDDLQRLHLLSALEGLIPWERRSRLAEMAPTHLQVPSGSRIAIDYSDPTAPVLAVRLQELFGLAETPRIAGGTVPLTLNLLSPANRPVQVTRDLASFWRTGYFEVRKDLRGRYPKHYWPDDPLTAIPTSRTRPGK